MLMNTAYPRSISGAYSRVMYGNYTCGNLVLRVDVSFLGFRKREVFSSRLRREWQYSLFFYSHFCIIYDFSYLSILKLLKNFIRYLLSCTIIIACHYCHESSLFSVLRSSDKLSVLQSASLPSLSLSAQSLLYHFTVNSSSSSPLPS